MVINRFRKIPAFLFGNEGIDACRELLFSKDERTRLVAFRALKRLKETGIYDPSKIKLSAAPMPAPPTKTKFTGEDVIKLKHSLMLNADQLGHSAQDVADLVEYLKPY